MEIPIVVPSMGRPHLLATQNVFHRDRVHVCVPNAEVKAYQNAHSDLKIIGHPDSLVGLTAKRQWIYDHFPNVVMIDDDIRRVIHMEHGLGEKAHYLNPDEATDLVDRLARECKEFGAYLFGVSSSADIRNFVSPFPFRTTGWVNGGFTGLLEGSKLAYNTAITCAEDFWISAMNGYHHRKCWVDTRYALMDIRGGGTMKMEGGMAFIRTLEREKNDNKILKQFFGDSFSKHRKSIPGRTQQLHEYQRSFSVPWA